jgi:two-component system sporulation sensor kinase B
MMYFLVIMLNVAAAILFFNNFKHELTKWATFSVICGSFGGLAMILGRTVVPSLNITILVPFLLRVTDVLVFVSQNGFHYGVLMFSIVYAEIFTKKGKRNLTYVLLVPVIFMLFVTTWNPYIRINYKFLLVWVLPYTACSIFLLLYSYFKESNRLKKKNRLVILIIILPTIIANVILNNIAKAWYPQAEFVKYLTIFIGYSFLMFIVFMFINGVLGIKLSFQKQLLDHTLKAVNSGTAILNHTIKNEITKISACMEKIDSLAIAKDFHADDYMQIISHSTNHMLAMVERIQEQIQDIVYHEHPHNLISLIDQTLIFIKPYLEMKNVKVSKKYEMDVDLLCDNFHIQEVLSNIYKNAIDAMNLERGELDIEVYSSKKGITLAIKDNGSGISKSNLPYVFNPFFTTKQRHLNFGLGLSYCYNVLQESGGSLEIHSEEGVGTTVFLHFSSKKVIRITHSTELRMVRL